MRDVDGEVEPHIDDIQFQVHKFTARPKPADPRNIVIFPCFSEFGTEVVGTLYCIPSFLQHQYQGKYSIALGWQGRSFLYSGLVDEFWEIDEKFQWLRKYCRAFHHQSKNLSRVERNLYNQGRVVSALEMGQPAVYPQLVYCLVRDCGGIIDASLDAQVCQKCGVRFPGIGVFFDPINARERAVWPKVSEEKLYSVAKYLKPNSVGITARNRSTYGRNLPSIFYERLIYLLEDLGYNPIWIGEKETILPCPFSRITDFSVTPEAKDLENTLALVSQLKFTVQFWTASTRLAGMVGTPYILFESPDQICGGTGSPGHEGFRMFLCSRGPKKLVLAHYNSVAENHNGGLALVERAVADLERGDLTDIDGMIHNDYWSFRKWKT